AWLAGRDMDIPSLIKEIQNPPFHSVGVLDLETFYPPKDRTELAMTLNILLASPTFASWLEGEPLDIKRLLYTKEGKPRLSIMSIAHLSDPERMFFVTILLNEILSWVRTQPGTSSLRAILYGYFPPTKNPPSKTPMLTLLKQARAYGLGCVLATQNPVDLDYKGLSNTGTWFLGRLQTERDKARVLEGLEGASIQAGQEFNKAEMEATLAGLGRRVFLMNNVHENRPVTFQTRWALSYLRGPLTRQQIRTLMDPLRPKVAEKPTPTAPGHIPSATKAKAQPAPQMTSSTATVRPVIPDDVKETFLDLSQPISESSRLVYRPMMLGTGELHFVRSTYKVDEWRETGLL
ncbi:ATP-binding protein, partial [Planctomycetaceae bacterium]|nr:ATP-binding protein [Planctomycetaceae bacterium]